MTRPAVLIRGLACAVVALVAAGCSTTAGHAPQAARTTTTRGVIIQLVGPNGPENQIVSARVTVPNVVGDSVTEANAAITAVGLVPAANPTVCHSHSTAVRSTVRQTVPSAGSRVARASLVVLC
jgi:hypothetical protein